jgi:hypothetical protein
MNLFSHLIINSKHLEKNMALADKSFLVIFAAAAGMLMAGEGLITKATTRSFNDQVTQLQDRAHALRMATPLSQCFYIDDEKPLTVTFSAYKHKGFWIGATFDWARGLFNDPEAIGAVPNLVEAPCLKLDDQARITPMAAESVALKGIDELLSGERAQALHKANPSGWLNVSAKP